MKQIRSHNLKILFGPQMPIKKLLPKPLASSLVISKNLKLRGVQTNVWKSVNIREAQIYIKNIKEQKKKITPCLGGAVPQMGGYLSPLGGVKISLLVAMLKTDKVNIVQI